MVADIVKMNGVFSTMFLMFYKRVSDWNSIRDNLQYNKDREIKLLNEELEEFYSSTALVDKLDAFLDFTFVLLGTIAKKINNREFELENYIVSSIKQIDNMYYLLVTEMLYVAEDIDIDIIENIIKPSMVIVMEANETKSSTKNSEGKITKPDNFVSPESKLNELLSQYGYIKI